MQLSVSGTTHRKADTVRAQKHRTNMHTTHTRELVKAPLIPPRLVWGRYEHGMAWKHGTKALTQKQTCSITSGLDVHVAPTDSAA